MSLSTQQILDITKPTYDIFERGSQYSQERDIIDVDGTLHPQGRNLTFIGYSYLPYEDGLSLYFNEWSGEKVLIRLRNTPECQQAIASDLSAYFSHAK